MMTKSKYYTMTEAFDNYENEGGIFSNTISYPWSSTITNELINDMYFSEYGECLAGTYILNRLKDSDTLDTESRNKISSMIAYRFITKWTKLWDTMFFDYNPICNYDMVEEETMTGSNENTVKNTGHSNSDTELSKTLNTKQTVSGSDNHTQNDTQTFNNNDANNITSNNTITKDLTDTKTENIENTVEGTETNNKSVYGFNSEVASPSEKIDNTKNETGSTTTNDTIKYTGTETNNQTGETITEHTGTIKNDSDYSGTNSNITDNTGTITDTDINNSEFTENNTSNSSNSSNRKLTRSGNIGVTTSQQMIEAERNLWLWDFFKVVFTDVNKMFTLPIF